MFERKNELLPHFPAEILRHTLFKQLDLRSVEELGKHPQFFPFPEYRLTGETIVYALQLLCETFPKKVYSVYHCIEEDITKEKITAMIRFVFETKSTSNRVCDIHPLYEKNKLHEFLSTSLGFIKSNPGHTMMMSSKVWEESLTFSCEDPAILLQAPEKIFNFLKENFTERKIKLTFLVLYLSETRFLRKEKSDDLFDGEKFKFDHLFPSEKEIEKKWIEVCRTLQEKKEEKVFRSFYHLLIYLETFSFQIRLDTPLMITECSERKSVT